MRILLVEDDTLIGDGLQTALKNSGYSVDWVKNGIDAVHSLACTEYQLTILDLGLPQKSGRDVLNDIRKKGDDIPILILTAQDSIQNRVDGLDSGADEYMVKPFALEELEARIRLLLRRKEGRKQNIIYGSDMTLNTVTRAISKGDISFVLSAREYALLYALMEHPKAILSRAQLEERIYGWNEEVESNTIEVHIHQLRQKLGKTCIKNIRGLGYTIQGNSQ